MPACLQREIIAILSLSVSLSACSPRGGSPAAKTSSYSAKKPADDPQNVRFDEIAARIWKSELGRLFTRFLEARPAAVLNLANLITDRIFSQPGNEFVRRSAIQILVEDLYQTHRMTPEISSRLMVLEGNINDRQFAVNSVPLKTILDRAPYFAIFGFFAGSSLVMAQAEELTGAAADAARLYWRTGQRTPIRSIIRRVDLRRLFSSEFFRPYSPRRALHGFIDSFAPYSFTYIYLFRERQALENKVEHGKLIIYSLEHLLEVADL